MLRALGTPKIQLLVIFAALLLVAAPPAGGMGVLPNLLAAVLPAVVLDAIWMGIESRRVRIPSSALLSGLIIFFILSTSESWLVVARLDQLFRHFEQAHYPHLARAHLQSSRAGAGVGADCLRQQRKLVGRVG